MERRLFTLIVVLVIDLLSFTCILPLFPSIIDFYSSNQDSSFSHFESSVKWLQSVIGVPDLHRYNNVFIGGIIGSLFSFLQYLSSPVLGAFSDVFGRKPVLIVSVCGSLLSYYIWSVSSTFSLFILSRVIGGLSKASVSIATTIVADICPNESRGKGMAFVGIAFSVAFLVGPTIGAVFASSAKTSAAISSLHTNVNVALANFAVIMTLIELVLIAAFLPETLEKPTIGLKEILSSAGNYIWPRRLFEFKILAEPNLVRQYGRIYFLFLFIYSGLEFTLCFLTHIRFSYDSMQQGRIYLYAGFLVIFIQGGYVRRIPSSAERQGALLGLAAIIPAFLLISVAYNQVLLFAGLSLYATASAMVVPCLTTLVSSHCDNSNKGSCMGVFRSIGALARACGPVFGSLMFWLLGPTSCYATGALLLAIPFGMLVQTMRKEKIKSQ